jgi:hypothetical protein
MANFTGPTGKTRTTPTPPQPRDVAGPAVSRVVHGTSNRQNSISTSRPDNRTSGR